MGATPVPVDVGHVERIEVHYALLDVLVLDGHDRTVPGLGTADFELFVDGEPVTVVSVDASCAAGQLDDPRAGRSPVPPTLQGGPPARFVHVFDYPHLEHASEALAYARAALERLERTDDEHVVAAFAPGLRIESPPARGPATALRALARMEQDRTLYDGAYDRLTERGFFAALRTLLDVLEVWSGAKVVLLYSGPFLADGFDHDAEHRDIAARASRARVALYTIDAGGMRTPTGFHYGDLGGPRTLARLAVETGGRMTYHTNDLGLGYARAQRDLACRYTLGFYDRATEPDRPRRLTIRSRRTGLRVVHSAAYAPGSSAERREGRFEGALAAPQLFPTGGLTVEVEPLGPGAPNGVHVRLRLPPEWGERTSLAWRVVGRITRRSGVVVRRFDQQLGADGGDRLELGDATGLWARPHRVTVVVGRAETETPFAAWTDFDVPRSDVEPGPQPPQSDSP